MGSCKNTYTKHYQNITDYDIQALVDNQLPPEKAAEVRTALETDLLARKRYEELNKQKEILKEWAKDGLLTS